MRVSAIHPNENAFHLHQIAARCQALQLRSASLTPRDYYAPTQEDTTILLPGDARLAIDLTARTAKLTMLDIKLPVRVPVGLHGFWLPKAALQSAT